ISLAISMTSLSQVSLGQSWDKLGQEYLDIDARAAAEELAVACLAEVFAVFDNDAAALDDGLGLAFDGPAFVGRIVDIHMFAVDPKGVFGVRVKNDDVCVGADGDRAFFGKEPEHLCRGGRGQLDKTIERDAIFGDAAAVDETHAVLNA